MPAALLMRRYGYKSGFITGLLLYGTGAFLFWPAALVDRLRVLSVCALRHRQRIVFS